MTDIDLDRLGVVWRQQPDPAELAELLRSAEAVRRRARLSQIIDVVTAIVVAGVVALLVLRNAKPDTLIIGGGAILLLLYSTIRQRRVRAAELKSLTGTTEQMLDQSIERLRLKLKNARSGLFLLPPAFLIGILVAYVADSNAGGEFTTRMANNPTLSKVIQVGAGIVFVLMAVYFVRLFRTGRRELERLTALREAYRQEQDRSTAE